MPGATMRGSIATADTVQGMRRRCLGAAPRGLAIHSVNHTCIAIGRHPRAVPTANVVKVGLPILPERF